MKKLSILLLSTQLLLLTCTTGPVKDDAHDYSKMDRATRKAYQRVDQFLQKAIKLQDPVEIIKHTRIDSILIDKRSRRLDIYLNNWLAALPLREANTALIYAGIKTTLGRKFKKYSVTIFSGEQPIEQLIPNFYRKALTDYDHARMPEKTVSSPSLVRNLSDPWQINRGLDGRHIALWPSHGWYYEQKLDRWEWQRARVFQTVEDLLPMGFTNHYLVPMLENAGAQVFLPRERDVQTNEVVIDNNTRKNSNSYQEYSNSKNVAWRTSRIHGFGVGKPPYTTGINPFKSGTARQIASSKQPEAGVRWIPDIPEKGDYAVYISFAASDQNVTDAHYTVYHSGGQTEFLVNQQMGGGTWIYLGKFKFKAGQNAAIGKVELSNQSQTPDKLVTADAVRFGGGMGNIARNGKVSGRPRFTEAARYYLQYAGMPDTLVYNLNEDQKDYNDDYQCRGEWVNYLKGAPFGPNRDRLATGLGIPIDLSLGFHTDAGRTRNDTVIGTLSIYSTEDYNDAIVFPNGVSRLANRDFADILQTQLVDDIRAKYDPSWNRRWLWDRGYSEAFRPNVPAALLELLSHHNFLDMKFGLDPDFRFHTSRAIYKAMLKFISSQYQLSYVVQPLPVSHFQATLSKAGQAVLKWKPTKDPLEATAVARQYIVYTRVEDQEFDNGVLAAHPEFVSDKLKPGTIYSFKVTAVNDGGESFPSEILPVCVQKNDQNPVLIVNGFDRIAAPATIETGEYLGFANFIDQGVPDKYDLDYTGTQYDFLADSPWLDDDAPGHGASYANLETTIIPGNTFDFPFVHGQSIRQAGHAFISTSDEAVMDTEIDITDYQYVDLVLGEEKLTAGPKPAVKPRFRAFPKALQSKLTNYCSSGGNLFISGAHVGFDLFENRQDSLDIEFGQKVLKYSFRTNHAVQTGGVRPVDQTFMPRTNAFEFNTTYNPEIYTVESPDAIEPADSSSVTLLRYSENNTSAAVGYKGKTDIIVFGFPFETIITSESRDQVMQSVFGYFDRKK